MFTALRQVAQRRALRFPASARCLATETAFPQSADGQVEETAEEQRQRYNEFLEQKAKELPTRPQLKLPTNENHGLYAFFRKVPVDGGMSSVYETVESPTKSSTKLGACRHLLLLACMFLIQLLMDRPILERCRAPSKVVQGPPHALVPCPAGA